MHVSLTAAERSALVELLASTIKQSRYPVSPRLMPLRTMLVKLAETPSGPSPAFHPESRAAGPSAVA